MVMKTLKTALVIGGIVLLGWVWVGPVGAAMQRAQGVIVSGVVGDSQIGAALNVDSNGNLGVAGTILDTIVTALDSILTVLEEIRDNTDPVPVYDYQTALERYISVGTLDDENEITGTAATLVALEARNASTNYQAYLKCTNATAANTTPGSTAVAYEVIVPGGGGIVVPYINTIFSTAITCYIVTGKADTDATDVVANDVSYNLRYRN